MGPLQTTASAGSTKKPVERTLTPYFVSGTIISVLLTLFTSGLYFSASNIIGTDGPNTSASRSPTLYFFLARAIARLTATVVLPTPPLPDDIAIIFLIPRNGSSEFASCFATISFGFTSILVITTSGPKASLSVRTIVLFIEEINGSFDLSGVIVNDIPLSLKEISETIPRDTMSFPFSGWITFLRAFRT